MRPSAAINEAEWLDFGVSVEGEEAKGSAVIGGGAGPAGAGEGRFPANVFSAAPVEGRPFSAE